MKKNKKIYKLPDRCSVCKTKIDRDSVGHTDPEMIFTCEKCFIMSMNNKLISK